MNEMYANIVPETVTYKSSASGLTLCKATAHLRQWWL